MVGGVPNTNPKQTLKQKTHTQVDSCEDIKPLDA